MLVQFRFPLTKLCGADMLRLMCRGNGDLTYEESKSHFTAWALLKSPLLISTDVRVSLSFPSFAFLPPPKKKENRR